MKEGNEYFEQIIKEIEKFFEEYRKRRKKRGGIVRTKELSAFKC